MLAPVTHILPLTNIRRARTLPVPGRVLVRVGQKVTAAEKVAQVDVPSRHTMLDIRRGLGIPKVSAAERCIVRQQGDKLEKGDVIAESGGLFARIIRAPVSGEIIAISNGMVLMRTGTTEMDVKAGFSGTVAEILQDRGAVIETSGALIQGVWGNGRVESGMLNIISQEPDVELTRQSLDVSLRGGVILAGTCSSVEALRFGAELPLRGLILASMPADLLPAASSLNYPILVLEGFGKVPINGAAYKLLSTSEKRDVSVNAVLNLAAGERPEIVIPLPAVGQPAPETDSFAPDKTVRIQGAPYAGRMGKFVQVRQGWYTLPNGLKVIAGDVQLDDDTRVTVPLANLEVIV